MAKYVYIVTAYFSEMAGFRYVKVGMYVRGTAALSELT